MTGVEASRVCAKLSQQCFEVCILEPLLNHHFMNRHLRVRDMRCIELTCVCIYIYIEREREIATHVYICLHVYGVCMYTYIYIERERER